MSGNPEMVTDEASQFGIASDYPDAKRLHNRFLVHLAFYAERVAEAKISYARTRTQRAKHAFEVNREAIVAIIGCYSDATNMTFSKAQAALGVSDAVFKELS